MIRPFIVKPVILLGRTFLLLLVRYTVINKQIDLTCLAREEKRQREIKGETSRDRDVQVYLSGVMDFVFVEEFAVVGAFRVWFPISLNLHLKIKSCEAI